MLRLAKRRLKQFCKMYYIPYHRKNFCLKNFLQLIALYNSLQIFKSFTLKRCPSTVHFQQPIKFQSKKIILNILIHLKRQPIYREYYCYAQKYSTLFLQIHKFHDCYYIACTQISDAISQCLYLLQLLFHK